MLALMADFGHFFIENILWDLEYEEVRLVVIK